MPIRKTWFGKPKIVGMQPGDITRLQQEQEHQRRVAESNRVKLKFPTQKQVQKRGFQVGQGLAEFGAVGQEQISFSKEQDAMMEIMSGGQRNRTWGTGENLPEINHDLNPRQRGDRSTGALFGF